jgi:hypothetical protein
LRQIGRGVGGAEGLIPDRIAVLQLGDWVLVPFLPVAIAMTRNAWNILAAGGPEAYPRAVAALREDSRAYWQECLAERPADGMAYAPTVDALGAWIGLIALHVTQITCRSHRSSNQGSRNTGLSLGATGQR